MYTSLFFIYRYWCNNKKILRYPKVWSNHSSQRCFVNEYSDCLHPLVILNLKHTESMRIVFNIFVLTKFSSSISMSSNSFPCLPFLNLAKFFLRFARSPPISRSRGRPFLSENAFVFGIKHFLSIPAWSASFFSVSASFSWAWIWALSSSIS